MLGKQGWRLMMNPNSLCAKVLKGKYYHQGDFLTAQKKNTPPTHVVLFWQAAKPWSWGSSALEMAHQQIFGRTVGSQTPLATNLYA
jgi:hypothetical protein